MSAEIRRSRSFRVKNEEEKKGMILWNPKTDAEKKLLELYAVDEEDIQDHNQNRSHGDRKGRNPGQEFDKVGGMEGYVAPRFFKGARVR